MAGPDNPPTARERLRGIFIEVLDPAPEAAADVERFAYRETLEWDSLRHMQLVAAIEREFDVMLETDDILGMSNFGKAIEILARYDVEMGT